MIEKQRYSIRKLGVGVGSILIGLTIYSNANVASASEKNSNNYGIDTSIENEKNYRANTINSSILEITSEDKGSVESEVTDE
ncbi:YSIRK-type signal peptide-containing protein, partial [Staphylococcus xylosus]